MNQKTQGKTSTYECLICGLTETVKPQNPRTHNTRTSHKTIHLCWFCTLKGRGNIPMHLKKNPKE